MRLLTLLLLLSAAAVWADDDVDKSGNDDARPMNDAIDATTHAKIHAKIHATIHAKIYETIDEASIGRVFLTRAERRWLDESRTRPAGASASAGTVVDESPTRDRRAAGFIHVPGKAPQVFRRGRFVQADPSSIAGQLSTAGTSGIVIVRHESPRPAERNDPAEAREP